MTRFPTVPSAGVLLLASLLFLLPAGSAAQSTRPGSVYSRYGIGERIDGFSTRAPSMGGMGYALGGGGFTSLGNPSLLADLLLTRASVGMQFDNLRITDAAGETSEVSSGDLSGFSLGIPLIAGKLGMALGLSPYSRIGYRIYTESSFDDVEGEPIEYGRYLEGNGGLDRAALAFGYSLSSRIAVGVRAEFMFGIIEDVRRTSFFNFRYEDVRLSESTRLRGFGLGVGARAKFPSLFREGDLASVGVALDFPSHLTGERVLMSGEAIDPDTLDAGIDGSVDLPVGIGVGLAWQSGPKFVAIADARYEPWSSFESSFILPGYNAGDGGRLEDRVRVSGGFEFYPAGRDLLAGFFRRTAYRLGAFYEQSYATPVPETRINSYGLTGGMSFPTLIPGTRVDVHVEVGNRGSTKDMLIQDRYLRIGVSLNFADRWFVRRRLG